MASSPLNDVGQRANFVILSLIRDAARDDPGTACCRFGLTLAQLKAISELPPEDVISIVTGMGNEAQFFPLDDPCRPDRRPRPSAQPSINLRWPRSGRTPRPSTPAT